MSTNPSPSEPQSPPEPATEDFALLDGYWEALRQGKETDPDQWVRVHPGDSGKLGDLHVLARLREARQRLETDSRLDLADLDAGLGPTAPVPSHTWLSSGTRLGECRIDGLLGYGGMGEVYLAEHEVLGRQVAVKVLPAPLAADPQEARRFHKSVQLLARLNPHPHIAAALHASEHEGRLYLVMEYVPGTDLRTLVRQSGPVPVDQACALIRQAALGLEYAHAQGLVHRDIKPANLMRTPDGTVKILDLGLARLTIPDRLDGEASQTGRGMVMGTVDYMAPEQARDSRQADARSDLYSLGCTFYFLLTGHAPFDHGPVIERLLAHAQAPLPDVQQARSDVPAPIAAIVRQLLAKRPEDRYPSARALVEALDAALPSSGSAAGRAAPAAHRWRGIRDWRWLAGAAALVAILIPVSLALFHHNSEPANPVAPVSETPLSGELILQVWAPLGQEGKAGQEIGKDLGALPVRRGERIHLHARLNSPAYVYLLWVDSQGRVDPLYPWEKRDIHHRPNVVQPQTEVHSPPERNRGWPMQGGSGLETALLLARRTPLPAEVNLVEVIGRLPPSPLRDPLEVAVRGFDSGRPIDYVNTGSHRGLGQEAQQIDAPLLQMMERLRPHFELIRAVRFAYKGE